MSEQDEQRAAIVKEVEAIGFSDPKVAKQVVQDIWKAFDLDPAADLRSRVAALMTEINQQNNPYRRFLSLSLDDMNTIIEALAEFSGVPWRRR